MARRKWKASRLYGIWADMKQRCNNPNCRNYKYYGGRGISYTKEWETYENFHEWAMASGYTDELTIDRIDVNGNYGPDNCRWTTWKEQLNNTRHNRNFTYNGETHTLAEWSEIKGIKYASLMSRLQRMTFDKAIEKEWEPRKIELIEYQGEQITKKELAKRLGINYSALRGMFQRGHSLEYILEHEYKPLKNPIPVTYLYNGEHLTLPQISKKCGVKYTTILYRMNKGLTLEQATQEAT